MDLMNWSATGIHASNSARVLAHQDEDRSPSISVTINWAGRWRDKRAGEPGDQASVDVVVGRRSTATSGGRPSSESAVGYLDAGPIAKVGDERRRGRWGEPVRHGSGPAVQAIRTFPVGRCSP